MTFSGGDRIAESIALVASTRERIRLTRSICGDIRGCCEVTAVVIQKSHATLLRCDEALLLYGPLRASRDAGEWSRVSNGGMAGGTPRQEATRPVPPRQ